MKKLITIAGMILILLAGTANAETFKCQSGNYWRSGGPVVVTATVDKEKVKASISVAGITHDAAYEVAGFDHRWNFGDHPTMTEKYGYTFIIQPDGSAKYYDFTKSETGVGVSPRQLFICKMTT